MAVIKPTIVDVSPAGDQSAYLVKWTPVTEADTYQAVSFPKHNDVSFQIFGTFGASTTILQGSNDSIAGTYFGLRGPDSVALSFTSAGGKAVLEHTLWTQPSSTGGTGQSLTVAMLFHFANPNRT